MTKARLITMLLALALALAATPAALAQEEEDGSSFDPAAVEGWDESVGLLWMHNMHAALTAMGVAEEDVDHAVDYLQEVYGALSEEERAALEADEAASGEMADEADMSADEAAALDEMNDDEEAIAEALTDDEEE